LKPKRILLLGILSALITTLLFYFVMNKTETSTVNTVEQPKMEQVVIANQDIAKDTEITSELLSMKEIPKELVHENSVKTIDEIIGTYALTDLKMNEMVMSHHVKKKEDEAVVVSRKITEGHRAVSILVDYVTGVSNMIQPEDEVDVVLTILEPVSTEIVVERVRVIAVGSRMTEAKSDGTEIAYQSVTLELTPEDMVKVIEAGDRGKLQLGLYSKSEPIEEQQAEIVEEVKIVAVAIKSNIRIAPSLQASVIEIVAQNTSLQLLGEQETETITWYKVKTPNNNIGWISNRIVEKE
jgi:pilus assembly protein CpaB